MIIVLSQYRLRFRSCSVYSGNSLKRPPIGLPCSARYRGLPAQESSLLRQEIISDQLNHLCIYQQYHRLIQIRCQTMLHLEKLDRSLLNALSSLHVCVNISTPNIHGRNGCLSKSWVIDALLYALRRRAIIYIAPIYVPACFKTIDQ